MGYPAPGYRPGSPARSPGYQRPDRGRPTPGARTPLPPWVPKRLPPSGLALGARVAARFLPWVGLGLLAWDLWSLYQMAGTPQHYGFTRVCATGQPVTKGYWQPFGTCGSAAAVGGLTAVSASAGSYSGFGRPNGANTFWTREEGWLRDGWYAGAPVLEEVPGVNAPFIVDPIEQPDDLPEVWPVPALDPLALPVYSPTPERHPRWRRRPAMRPDWGVNNPWRSPTESTTRGEPSNRPNAPPQFPRPPRAGEREVKRAIVAVTGQSLPGKAMNIGTETEDFVSAIWKAIDKSGRSKASRQQYVAGGIGRREKLPTMQNMLRDIWNNARSGKLNWSKALDNLIENQFEDYAFGRIGQVAAKANRARNVPGGVQMGPVF